MKTPVADDRKLEAGLSECSFLHGSSNAAGAMAVLGRYCRLRSEVESIEEAAET
jgi:hypothetical protein